MSQTPDEELVRRLLAESRADEPMPADVAARLDGVLDDLGHERRAVVPLRRAVPRRRRWAVALVAAAAVVVGGVTLRSISVGGPESATTGDAASESAGGGRAGDQGARAPGLAAGGIAELHRATLAADVRRTLRDLRTPTDASGSPSEGPSSACAPADWGPGTVVPARLDGADAVLVLRPPAGGRRVADVLECGTARVLASVAVPAR